MDRNCCQPGSGCFYSISGLRLLRADASRKPSKRIFSKGKGTKCFYSLDVRARALGDAGDAGRPKRCKGYLSRYSAILDKWFACYSKAGSPQGSADQYLDLLAEVGTHLGMPMRREDLENFFSNPTEQREFAVKSAQVLRAFSELSANTSPQIIEGSTPSQSG